MWGRVHAGAASNAIPEYGECQGTVRSLDAVVWHDAPALITRLVHSVVEPYGVTAEVQYERGVPPVVNDARAAAVLAAAGTALLGPDGVVPAEQSLGGEDFAWMLEQVPGALGRLGTTRPGEEVGDLHRPTFDAAEEAIVLGVQVLVAAALLSL